MRFLLIDGYRRQLALATSGKYNTCHYLHYTKSKQDRASKVTHDNSAIMSSSRRSSQFFSTKDPQALLDYFDALPSDGSVSDYDDYSESDDKDDGSVLLDTPQPLSGSIATTPLASYSAPNSPELSTPASSPPPTVQPTATPSNTVTPVCRGKTHPKAMNMILSLNNTFYIVYPFTAVPGITIAMTKQQPIDFFDLFITL